MKFRLSVLTRGRRRSVRATVPPRPLRELGKVCPRRISAKKLTRPLDTQWQRAAELLLDEADVAEFSKQVKLALFYDAKLDVAAMA